MREDPPSGVGVRGRLVRWLGVWALALRRLTDRGSSASTRQVWLSVAGVAVAVALVVLVTGVSLSLATETTVRSADVDYWVVPESGSASTAVVSVSGPQLGDVHDASARIDDVEGVDYVTPVQLELVRMRTDAASDAQYVLAVGVVPGAGLDSVAGLSTGSLRPGDPHYANGSYEGPWTGEAVLSSAAADRLDASAGETLQVNTTGTRSRRRDEGAANGTATGDASVPPGFRVAAVATPAAGTGPMGELPIAVVHLSELQSVTGAARGDQANQLLVKTGRPGVRADLRAAFPEASVVSSQSVAVQQVVDSDLPLAMALASTAVALLVGTLFVATTLGLDSVGDRQRRAVLAAVGVSPGTRRLLVAAQALGVALLGGLAGVVLGLVAIAVANLGAARYLAVSSVAQFHPFLALLGVGVALAIGLLVTPYLLWLDGRTSTLAALTR